jgi:radical SAM superfamily enzyme YgiQ (UPF0313 family)
MRKNVTVDDIKSAVEIINKYDIDIHAFFMLGLPQETIETLDDTIHLIKNLPVDLVILNYFTPYYGTELFNYCLQKGIISEEFDYSLYNHQSPYNHFCPAIPEAMYHAKIKEIEILVDKINSRRILTKRIKSSFSKNNIRRMKELGIRGSIYRISNLIRNTISKI